MLMKLIVFVPFKYSVASCLLFLALFLKEVLRGTVGLPALFLRSQRTPALYGNILCNPAELAGHYATAPLRHADRPVQACPFIHSRPCLHFSSVKESGKV